MADLGQLAFQVRAQLGELDKDLAEAKKKGTAAGKDLGDSVTEGADSKLKTLGGKLTKALTPAAAAVAVTSGIIAQSWSGAQRDMQATTGATGAKLDSLMGSVQNVAGTVKGGMGAIADTMATLAAKTGMTGPPLEKLTQQIMGLKELGIQVSAADVGGAFGRWAVPTDQWGASLERVLKISQATGVAVPDLLTRIADGAPIMQGLGFNFNQASLLAGRLSTDALPGLKAALGKIAKAHGDTGKAQDGAKTAQEAYTKAVAKFGPDSAQAEVATKKLAKANDTLALSTANPMDALKAMIDRVKNAKTTIEADGIAIDYFGKKAGPELALQIRAGKFSIDQLSAAVDNNGGSIMKTVEGNRTWIDQLGLFKDKAAAAVGPYAEKISGISTAIAGIGEAGATIGKAVGWLKGLGGAADVAAVSTGLLSTAEAAEGVTAGVAAAPTLGLAAGIWAVAWPVLAVLAAIGLLIGAFLILTKVFGLDAPTAIGILLMAIMPLIGLPLIIIANWDAIRGFFGGLLGAVGGFFTGAWNLISSGGVAAFRWVMDKGSEFVGFITSIPGRIAGALGDLFGPLIRAAQDAIHWLDQVASKISSIPGDIGGSLLSGATGGLSGLFGYASGGVVPGPVGAPQLAVVHGGEVVTPPGQMERAVGLSGAERSSGGGGGNTYITVQGGLIASREVLALVRDNADRKRRNNGTSGI